MIYGGEPLKPFPPAKQCNTRTMGLNGPGAYSYGLLAKQPGSDYKIRIRDLERMNNERYRINKEENFKILNRNTQHTRIIELADQKFIYNQIKKMVDDEMKANEHLFVEECPKKDLEEDVKKPKFIRMSIEEKQRILEESKKIKDEENRKISEEKRLQQFIENSTELRISAVSKRRKLIADLNYKIIQENENITKEKIIKNRQLANLENTELFKSQLHEKMEKKRKNLEQKQQFRNDINKQLVERDIAQEKEKKLKDIEHDELMKLIEKVDEEKKIEKLKRTRHRKIIIEEMNQLIDNRKKIFSKWNDMRSNLNKTFKTMLQDVYVLKVDESEAKAKLRRENEIFMKNDLMIKEERRKQEEEMSKILTKKIKEIEEFKLSVELENYESRRKRIEEGNKILDEQMKALEALVEQQKETKREAYEEMMKNHENYLKDEKESYEKRKHKKWQYRTDLRNQINTKNMSMEKQKMIELKEYQQRIAELAKQEELLQKLLKEV